VTLARLGWRSIVLVNVTLLAASSLLQGQLIARMPSVRTSGTPVPIDVIGTVLLGVTLVLPIAAVRATGPTAYALMIGGIVFFFALTARERRAPSPIIDFKLIRQRAFVTGAGVLALQSLAMYSLLVFVPVVYGRGGQWTDYLVGLALTAMTAAMAIGAPIGGRLASLAGLRWVVLGGGLLGAAGVVAPSYCVSETEFFASEWMARCRRAFEKFFARLAE